MLPQLPQIITSLLETDLYKFSMGQAIYHQFPSYRTTWTFKCRNPGVVFTEEMVREINEHLDAYARLWFTEDELEYLSGIEWIKEDYVEFLRLWRPDRRQITVRYDLSVPCHMTIETAGTWLNTSMYEIPILAIVNEVYFKLNKMWTDENGETVCIDYPMLLKAFQVNLDNKFNMVEEGRWRAGTFSEFGLRRRLSAEAQEMVVRKFACLKNPPEAFARCQSRFIGTSNVYLAKKLGLTPVGTMAHEWIMCVGQGNHKHNPAYSNWYALDAWIKEYGVLNGIALTDTIGTDVFLRDFQRTYATLFSGVRHDSSDPIEWGEKMLKHYRKLGIDGSQKTLLFSDSLNFQKADQIYRHFQDRCNVAFGIGTYLANDTCVPPLNIVMKVTKCNGQDVAKLSDTEGKGMCKNPEYIDYLKRSIDWRMRHETQTL